MRSISGYTTHRPKAIDQEQAQIKRLFTAVVEGMLAYRQLIDRRPGTFGISNQFVDVANPQELLLPVH